MDEFRMTDPWAPENCPECKRPLKSTGYTIQDSYGLTEYHYKCPNYECHILEVNVRRFEKVSDE